SRRGSTNPLVHQSTRSPSIHFIRLPCLSWPTHSHLKYRFGRNIILSSFHSFSQQESDNEKVADSKIFHLFANCIRKRRSVAVKAAKRNVYSELYRVSCNFLQFSIENQLPIGMHYFSINKQLWGVWHLFHNFGTIPIFKLKPGLDTSVQK